MRVWILLILFSTACQFSKKKESKIGKIAYQYIALGEGVTPKEGEYMKVYLSVCDEQGDTIHYVPGFTYFIKIEDNKLDSALSIMIPGDSMHFTCAKSDFNQKFNFYSLLADTSGKAILRVGFEELLAADEVEMAKKKAYSLREIKEQEALIHYLDTSKDEFEEFQGIYRCLKRESKDIPLAFNDIVELDYKGYFLNGYVFDDTKKKGASPRFVFGEELQLIEGIQYGLIGTKEGESIKIIVPSRRGFGEDGSVAGIVPPYTTVIFDIHIKKVIKQR